MEILDEEFEQYSLEHHGIKGQVHGVRHGPPYPLDRNEARQARKKEKAKKREERSKERETKRKAKKKAATLKKARQAKAKKKEEEKKAAEKKEQEQKKKEKILKGSPEKVYKNRHLFTKEEIQPVLERFEWEKKLNTYSADRLNTMANKAASMTKMMASAATGYNTVASAYNAWFPDGKQLPRINLGGGGNNENRRRS